MTPIARFRVGVTGLVILIGAGTLGYVLVEGAAPFDALYMVMITISTVGFSEVFALSTGGRALTLVIMLLGVGLGFYTAGAGIEQLFVLGATRRTTRIQRMIDELSGHVILCGFGRIGRGVWSNLRARGIEAVVIEVDQGRAEDAREAGAHIVEGDATHNEVLLRAGIDRARTLVACVREDSDNLVIVLSARALCPDLHIVSRASEAESESKLRLGGADRVVSPQVVGSERLAAMAVEPDLAEIFDVFVGGRPIEFAVEEIRVSSESPLVGTSIREAQIREKTGALILAVEDRQRRLMTTPAPDQIIEGDSVVIVVGDKSQVANASRLLESP